MPFSHLSTLDKKEEKSEQQTRKEKALEKKEEKQPKKSTGGKDAFDELSSFFGVSPGKGKEKEEGEDRKRQRGEFQSPGIFYSFNLCSLSFLELFF